MWVGAGLLAQLSRLRSRAHAGAAGRVERARRPRLRRTHPVAHEWSVGLTGVRGMLAPGLLRRAGRRRVARRRGPPARPARGAAADRSVGMRARGPNGAHAVHGDVVRRTAPACSTTCIRPDRATSTSATSPSRATTSSRRVPHHDRRRHRAPRLSPAHRRRCDGGATWRADSPTAACTATSPSVSSRWSSSWSWWRERALAPARSSPWPAPGGRRGRGRPAPDRPHAQGPLSTRGPGRPAHPPAAARPAQAHAQGAHPPRRSQLGLLGGSRSCSWDRSRSRRPSAAARHRTRLRPLGRPLRGGVPAAARLGRPSPSAPSIPGRRSAAWERAGP